MRGDFPACIMRRARARGASHEIAARDVFARLADGALAQLVERYTGSVEVRGSTPLGSTIIPAGYREFGKY